MGADGGDAVGNAAGGDHGSLLAKLSLHAVDHAVQQQGRAKNAAAFHAVHRIGSDGTGRRIQRDVGQQRRVRRQCGQGQLDAGDDGAAAKRAVAVQHRDGGGGAHVDKDQRGLVDIQRAHGGHQQVTGQRGRIIQQHGEVRADGVVHHHGLYAGEHPHRFAQRAIHLRHNGGENGSVKGVRGDMGKFQQTADGDGVFRAGGQTVGGQTAAIADGAALHAAHDDMGVSDVQCKDHSVFTPLPFCTAVLRAASLPLLNTTALAMTAPVKKQTMASTRPLTPTKAMMNRNALGLPRACTKF